MTGYHTRWVRPEESADDPERIAIREVLALGKALYDIGLAVGTCRGMINAGGYQKNSLPSSR